MTDKKQSTSYIAMLNQVLAQFDLQTKVRGIATQVFEKLLNSNNQAFQHIAESQKKLIDFQSRLHKAQNMHQTIHLGVDHKMKVTQQLRLQFNNFTSQFWNKMKENVQQNGQIKRKIDTLLNHQRKQTLQIQKNIKDMARFNTVTTNLDQKIDQQVHKVMKSMSLDFQKTNQDLQQRKIQIQKLIEKISQSKALLDSKSKLVDDLLEDLGLYKYQKKTIDQRIDNLYNEISQRIHKTQFYDMRKYFDGVIIQQKNNTQDRFKKHWHIICQNQKKQDKQNSIIHNIIKNLKQEIQIKFNNVKQEAKEKNQQLHDNTQKCENTLLLIIQELKNDHSEKIAKNLNQIIDLQIATKNNLSQINKFKQQSQKHDNHINQAQSNILSINEKISMIINENLRREQQLSKLQQSSESSGDLSSRLASVMESLLQIKDVLNTNQDKITQNYKQFVKNKKQTNEAIQNLESSFSNNKISLNIRLEQHLSKLKKSQDSLIVAIQKAKSQTLKYTDQTIFNIRSQLDNLDRVSKQINDFKIVFEKQVQQTDKVNIQVKQKIQRLSSSLIKLKSDHSIKIQKISQEMQRKTAILKQFQKSNQNFKNYLTTVHQMINIALAVQLWSTSLSDPNYQIFKLSSLVDGWILQIEGKQKIRYRSQSLSRTKLLQIAIDHFVKLGDKLKGIVLNQSGKQTFEKILDGNTEIGSKTSRMSRKRSVSKRRQSELPKLYK